MKRLPGNERRRSVLALGMLGGAALLMAAELVFGALWARTSSSVEGARLVRELGLSDLTLFTEARYARHPSQADLATPFQDHPLALDHFPSGSLVAPQRPAGGTATSMTGGKGND